MVKYKAYLHNKMLFNSVIIFALSIICFGFLGNSGYQWFDDSEAYSVIHRGEGIMPLYPLFLYINQVIFGEEAWKSFVVWEQIIITGICITVFVMYIQRKFELVRVESILIFIASIIPFTIEMPNYMIPHAILTEGLAFPLFYIFFVFILAGIIDEKFGDIAISAGLAFVLSLIRSQLQLAYIITACVFFYIAVKKIKSHGIIKLGKIALLVVSSALIIATGVLLTMKTYSFYVNRVVPGLTQEKAGSRVEENADEAAISNSQFNSVIFNRGFFEVDEEDVYLFTTEEEKEIFRILYDTIDSKGLRYSYAEPGLWMWKGLSTGPVGTAGFEALLDYYAHKEPELTSTRLYNRISETLAHMGRVVLQEHFGRYIYHTIRLMIPGFISTVFFQIDEVYLLCHIITLFIYVSAAFMCFINWRQSKNGLYSFDKRINEFMLVCIVINIIFVGVTNLIFEGIQRYVVYGFGIFYIAYYILLRKLVLENMTFLKKRSIKDENSN